MDSGSDDCCEGGGNDCEGCSAAAGGGEGALEGGGAGGGVSSVEREGVLVEDGSIESSAVSTLPGRDCDGTCDGAFADGDVWGAGRASSKDSTLEVGGAAVDGEEVKGELGGGVRDLDKVSADAASVSSRKKDKGCHHCCLI